ncbi:MAG: type III secretion system translocon subunit SctE [Chlamydiales bacterium]
MTTAIKTHFQPLDTNSHPSVDSNLLALTTGLSLLSASAPTPTSKDIQFTDQKPLKDLAEIAVKSFDENLKKQDGELDLGRALKDALLSMIKAMGDQQLISTLNETKLSQFSNQIGQALSNHIKEVGDKQLDKINEAERKQRQASMWQKIGAAFSALIGAVLIATGVGVGAGIMLIASAVLIATGALDAITNAISSGIEKSLIANGMDKEKAKQVSGIIAAVIVTVAIAILGAGAGAAGSIAQGGIKAATTATTQFAKAAAKSALSFGTMGITQTGLTGQIMRALPDEWFKDKKTKELVAGIVTILVDIILMLVSLKLFTSMGSGAKSAGGITEKLQKFLNLSPDAMAKAMQGVQIINTAGMVGSGIGQGTVQISLAKVIKALAKYEAETSFLNSVMKQLDETNKERMSSFDTEMETMQEVQKSVNQGVRATFAPVQA